MTLGWTVIEVLSNRGARRGQVADAAKGRVTEANPVAPPAVLDLVR
jgi:hypothetical protein